MSGAAETRLIVEVSATAGAEPAATVFTKRTERKGQKHLLPNERRKIDLIHCIETQRHLISTQLSTLVRLRFRGQDKLKFFLNGEAIAFEAAAATSLNGPSQPALKKYFLAGSIISKAHVEERRKAKVSTLARVINPA